MSISGRLSASLILATLGWMFFVSVGVTTRLLGKDQGGPYEIKKTDCKEDAQQTNGCEFGSNTSCPMPLSNSDYFCSSYDRARICMDSSENTCVLYTNRSCGWKKYCKSAQDVKDGNGDSILCSGAPDICLVKVVEPPDPID